MRPASARETGQPADLVGQRRAFEQDEDRHQHHDKGGGQQVAQGDGDGADITDQHLRIELVAQQIARHLDPICRQPCLDLAGLGEEGRLIAGKVVGEAADGTLDDPDQQHHATQHHQHDRDDRERGRHAAPPHALVQGRTDPGDKHSEEEGHQDAGCGMHARDHDHHRRGGHQIGVRNLPAVQPARRRGVAVRRLPFGNLASADLARIGRGGFQARSQVTCSLPRRLGASDAGRGRPQYGTLVRQAW